MILYNSLTRKKEEFIPYEEGKVKMYTCGPTVYNYAHIGNLRSYIVEDILERSLGYLGYDVTRCMNITDVGHLSGDSDDGEDKMVKSAQAQKKSVLDIARYYTECFKKDFEHLNLHWPSIVVPATSLVDFYIEIITKLLEKGYAYKSNGNIYFDITKLNEYYVFSSQTIDDVIVGARDTVEHDEGKRNPQDFALWFTKSKFENQALKWDSPWGEGYPGWHIECSGISIKNLGEYLDIHCGGVDNKFPHHTNEIAQSEAYLGHKWCKYWTHVEHLNLESGKMSKSSGNFITIQNIIDKGYNPICYKFYVLLSHYRKELPFSFEKLDATVSTYNKLINKINSLKYDENEKVDEEVFNEYKGMFRDALGNDLNTATAISTIYDTLKADTNDMTKIKLLESFDTVLGLDLVKGIFEDKSVADNADDKWILDKIEERKNCKANKDYAGADAIRNELLEKGIELIDTREGTTYRKN